jgi:hypothetical protein
VYTPISIPGAVLVTYVIGLAFLSKGLILMVIVIKLLPLLHH